MALILIRWAVMIMDMIIVGVAVMLRIMIIVGDMVLQLLIYLWLGLLSR